MAALPLPTHLHHQLMPLADACVTEWRQNHTETVHREEGCHSLMLVLLNGGSCTTTALCTPGECHSLMLVLLNGGAHGVLCCVVLACHSLMLVLLNGGTSSGYLSIISACHSLMLVLLNGGPCPWVILSPHPMPLADACVTEWRLSWCGLRTPAKKHATR